MERRFSAFMEWRSEKSEKAWSPVENPEIGHPYKIVQEHTSLSVGPSGPGLVPLAGTAGLMGVVLYTLKADPKPVPAMLEQSSAFADPDMTPMNSP